MDRNIYYEEFAKNPAIRSIANNDRWTISTKQKVPIDMYMLLYMNTITGAITHDTGSLVKLTEIDKAIPGAANYAYYLMADRDKLVVLDIEPTCPQTIKDKFLKMPALYAETSMSGKGIHLIFNLPIDLMKKYPVVNTKKVMKEEHGWYEILLEHYVTFTGHQIKLTTPTTEKFEEIFEQLARKQKEYIRVDTHIKELDAVKTNHIGYILEQLLYYSERQYNKTPEDFNNDMSRYEFSYLGWLYTKTKEFLNITNIKKEHIYTDSEIAWIMHETAKEFLPYRAKHDEMRNDLPWLLFEIQEIMSKSEKPKEKSNKKPKGDKKA